MKHRDDRLEPTDPLDLLDSDARSRLAVFAELLESEAAPRGLIGFLPESIGEQIARSLLLLEPLGRPGRLIDVGSGAGLPGIPLLIALGSGVLIEPRRKAATFLERVIRRLGLDGTVVVSMAEEAGRSRLRDWADAVVARAVGAPAAAAELCAPLCRPGGVVLLTAAPGTRAEALPVDVCAALGLGPAAVLTVAGRVVNAGGDISQQMLMMSKVEPTPDNLPRRPGTARRRPLGLHGGPDGSHIRS